MKRYKLGLILIIFLAMITFYTLNNTNKPKTQTNPEKNTPNTTTSKIDKNFKYANITFLTDGNLDFVVEDENGNKTGYNPQTKSVYNYIPSSSYNKELLPGEKISENKGVKVFEAKVFDNYKYKITMYGLPQSKFFYDYSMVSNIYEKYNDREVKDNLTIDNSGKAEFTFSYDFSEN